MILPEKRGLSPGNAKGPVPSGLSLFLCFELLDECSEVPGDGSRKGVVLILEGLPNC